MGITKTEKFTTRQNEIAQLAKVLGHPARIAILEELLKLDSCYCGGLTASLGLAQATISQHLKELKNVGLIKGDIEGTSVCYCINTEKLPIVSELFQNFFQKIKNNNKECC